MSDDIENQLQNLLNDLNSVNEYVQVEKPVHINEPQEIVAENGPEIVTDTNTTKVINEDVVELQLEPVDQDAPSVVRDPSKNAELISKGVSRPVEKPIIDLHEQFEQLDNITEEIIIGTRSDRQETQSTIDLIRNEIDKAISSGREPARMYLDNLVNALGVKSEINMTAVKALETKAKFIAATKVGTIINNNINSSSGFNHELAALLDDNPLDIEDE